LVNTPLSHERLVVRTWLAVYSGWGTHVTHFVQLYPQPLYTVSQVLTTSRSWDKWVLTDLCLTLCNHIERSSYVQDARVVTYETTQITFLKTRRNSRNLLVLLIILDGRNILSCIRSCLR